MPNYYRINVKTITLAHWHPDTLPFRLGFTRDPPRDACTTCCLETSSVIEIASEWTWITDVTNHYHIRRFSLSP